MEAQQRRTYQVWGPDKQQCECKTIAQDNRLPSGMTQTYICPYVFTPKATQLHTRTGQFWGQRINSMTPTLHDIPSCGLNLAPLTYPSTVWACCPHCFFPHSGLKHKANSHTHTCLHTSVVDRDSSPHLNRDCCPFTLPKNDRTPPLRSPLAFLSQCLRHGGIMQHLPWRLTPYVLSPFTTLSLLGRTVG